MVVESATPYKNYAPYLLEELRQRSEASGDSTWLVPELWRALERDAQAGVLDQPMSIGNFADALGNLAAVGLVEWDHDELLIHLLPPPFGAVSD